MNETDLKIILEVKAGSHAYGTSTRESDNDFRGIAIAPLPYYMGCSNRFEQLEIKEPDRVIYDLIKYCRLALDANPNILEILYTDEEDTITITEAGRLLRKNRDIFLSKKVCFSYMGYAFSQVKRMRSHRGWLMNPKETQPLRSDFGLPNYNILTKDQQESFLWVVARVLKDTLDEAKLPDDVRDTLQNANLHGCLQSRIPTEILPALQDLTHASNEFIVAMQRERAYSAAMAEYNSYQIWKKTRNPKRAELEKKFNFDTKNALHIVRLIRTGEELLTGQGLIVKRPDAEELLAIRNGAWTFEQVEEYAATMEVKFKKLMKTSTLPEKPDVKKANALCQEILCNALYPEIVVTLI
jgi:predicted nucleotidyltransferase